LNYNSLDQTRPVQDDEIDLKKLVLIMWQGKLCIVIFIVVFALISVIYSINLKNIYKSELVLVPAVQQQNGALPGQLGGLAALAGVSLGNSGSVDKTTLALEIIKSKNFVAGFIAKHNILVELMALESWDSSTNNMVVDKEIYDTTTKTWVREVSFPKKTMPSMQEAYLKFMESFGVSRDTKSGVITLSFKHYSPYFSKQVLDWIVLDINDRVKIADIEESRRSIEYLEEQIATTNISEVKSTLFSLVEEQVKNLMLANTRSEYVFKVVDPALVPENKFEPKRMLIVAVSSALGCLLGIFSVVFFPSLRKEFN